MYYCLMKGLRIFTSVYSVKSLRGSFLTFQEYALEHPEENNLFTLNGRGKAVHTIHTGMRFLYPKGTAELARCT